MRRDATFFRVLSQAAAYQSGIDVFAYNNESMKHLKIKLKEI